MKVALLGYGKMGQAIEQELLDEATSHEIILRIDSDNRSELTLESLSAADVAIEFSTPDSAIENIKMCFEANVPVVSGTTGWLRHLSAIKQLCREKNQTLFYATNYSVGVNIFFEMTRKLAEFMNQQEHYDVSIDEIHHIHKLDKPSGTGITTAEILLDQLDRKGDWKLDEAPSSSDIAIYSHRQEEVPGTHTVTFTHPIDTIRLSHEAHSRAGFVKGAIAAAKWVKDKKGVFGMKDMLGIG
ncbi:MAG: 4-hydroxy-tetrahydrodipicolinate reductase [Saprospiraceae bacterium]|nr:4-hydroxy-tetrahydrodipicolinate reductase [Saprospiraceae bacterium]